MMFNWVDYVLLAVFFISILGGLMRGGIREVFSLITWIAAFVVAGMFAKPMAIAFASSGTTSATTVHVSTLALGVSFTVLFLAVLLAGSLLGYFANRVVEGAGISFFNRSLGAIFGFVRGYLVSLLLIFVGQLSPLSQQPYWGESVLVAKFQPAVEWLGKKVQPDFESLKSQMGETLDNISSSAQNALMKKEEKQ